MVLRGSEDGAQLLCLPDMDAKHLRSPQRAGAMQPLQDTFAGLMTSFMEI